MFGLKNPADKAMPYYNQIGNATQQYYQPYMTAGQNQLGGLQDQYSSLLGDPGGKLNDIGSHYKQSPGFQFAMQQALQGGNHAAGAGGMFGSPQHEQQNMQLANDIASQDYNKWLTQATGLYGQGMQGAQGMANQGQQAGQSFADQISNQLAQQGHTAYQGQENRNQNITGLLGGLGGLAYSFL